jgi:hypothetical protein
MNLDPFEGEYVKWPAFWDTFDFEIHQNPRLTNLEKLRLLSLLMKGDAKEQVRLYANKPKLYERALSDLKDTYDRPTLVRDVLVASFRNRKRTMTDVLADMRDMVRQMDSVCATFEMLTLPDQKHVYELRSLVFDQLRPDLQRKFADLPNRELPAVQALLRRELRQLESVAADCNKTTFQFNDVQVAPPSRATDARPFGNPRQTRARTLLSVQGAQGIACYFCQGGHLAGNCPTAKTIADRLRVIREKRLCARCLLEGHQAASCPVQRPCYCGQTHHPLLCEQRETRQAAPAQHTLSISVHRPLDAGGVDGMGDVPMFTESGRVSLMTLFTDLINENQR